MDLFITKRKFGGVIPRKPPDNKFYRHTPSARAPHDRTKRIDTGTGDWLRREVSKKFLALFASSVAAHGCCCIGPFYVTPVSLSAALGSWLPSARLSYHTPCSAVIATCYTTLIPARATVAICFTHRSEPPGPAADGRPLPSPSYAPPSAAVVHHRAALLANRALLPLVIPGIAVTPDNAAAGRLLQCWPRHHARPHQLLPPGCMPAGHAHGSHVQRLPQQLEKHPR